MQEDITTHFEIPFQWKDIDRDINRQVLVNF